MGAGSSMATATEAPKAASFCSWCMREMKQDPILCDSVNAYHRCPFEDCERTLHACMFPGCIHWACLDAYGAVDPEEAIKVSGSLQLGNISSSDHKQVAKPERIERSDWLCLMHGGAIADFSKCHWRSLSSLESYRSIHASLTVDLTDVVRGFIVGAVATVAAGATRMASASPMASATAIAAFSFLEDGFRRGLDSIVTVMSRPTAITGTGGDKTLNAGIEDAWKGVGRPRFGPAACGGNGLPLATGASCLVAYGIYKRMPTFRERGFVLERPGLSDLPTVITIDGFFHTGEHTKCWSRIMDGLFPKHTWFSLQWDASPTWGVETAAQWILASTKDIYNVAAAGSTAVAAAYTEAKQNCYLTSFLLADAICRLQPDRKIILLGHSLGASMILSALKLMGASHSVLDRAESIGCPHTDPSFQGIRPRIQQTFLLGSASPSGQKDRSTETADVLDDNLNDWDIAARAVKHRIFNFHSPDDQVLNMLGMVSKTGGRAGTEPVWSRSGKVVNVECSEVTGHGVWKEALDIERVRVFLKGHTIPT
ncbi:hypothetical protein HDU97_001494 [Phlyctochytrium planicorne]|nr:hypothetical protein HDU97_001494 [Phlyctochytrium planicorne]